MLIRRLPVLVLLLAGAWCLGACSSNETYQVKCLGEVLELHEKKLKNKNFRPEAFKEDAAPFMKALAAKDYKVDAKTIEYFHARLVAFVDAAGASEAQHLIAVIVRALATDLVPEKVRSALAGTSVKDSDVWWNEAEATE